MKITLVMVTTVNGKITHGSDPHVSSWTSPEDQAYFAQLKRSHQLLVYGSATYEAAKGMIDLTQDNLRVVLTRDPTKYKKEEVPGKLEFSSESPRQLVERLSSQGFDQMLLLGGGVINHLFFQEKLIDELHLTLEPRIFATGKTLVEPTGLKGLDVSLRLISLKQLNKSGTLFLKYEVVKQ